MSKKRGNDHINAQRQGRRRDHGICQICGSTKHPEGHHAFDFQYGGSSNVNNIVTLCHNCHTKVHNGIMDILVF